MDYAQTVDAIKKQWASQNTVNLSLDGWIATSTLDILSVIAYYVDGDWALCEVPLTFDEVDCLFIFCFER